MSPIPGVSKHARIRFAERHGPEPAREVWLAAALSIIDRRAALLDARCPGGGEKWRVAIGPIECDVIWQPASGEIVTVLPPSRGMASPTHPAHRWEARRGAAKTKAFIRQRHRWQGEGRDA